MLIKECPMSHIRVLICRVDDAAAEQITELAAFGLPPSAVPAAALPSAVER